MKKFLVILIIAGFVSIAIFGFFAVGSIEYGDVKCIASVAAHLPCPENGGLGHFVFHFNIIKSFSLALLAQMAVILTVLIMVFISFIIKSDLSACPIRYNFLRQSHEQSNSFVQEMILRWITFFEKRDPLTVCSGA